MKDLKITQQDYIKANRKSSREEEIALHGKPIRWRSVQVSKKIYNRKRNKAGAYDLPLLFLWNNTLLYSLTGFVI